eukprot:scaffold221676_cov31-Tisochrysis_lutea.AAC.6
MGMPSLNLAAEIESSMITITSNPKSPPPLRFFAASSRLSFGCALASLNVSALVLIDSMLPVSSRSRSRSSTWDATGIMVDLNVVLANGPWTRAKVESPRVVEAPMAAARCNTFSDGTCRTRGCNTHPCDSSGQLRRRTAAFDNLPSRPTRSQAAVEMSENRQ